MTKLLPQIKGDDVNSTKEQIRDPRARERREKRRQSPEKDGKETQQQGPPCRNEAATGRMKGGAAPESPGKAREAGTNEAGAEPPLLNVVQPTVSHISSSHHLNPIV